LEEFTCVADRRKEDGSGTHVEVAVIVAECQVVKLEDAGDVAGHGYVMGGECAVNNRNTNLETVVELELELECGKSTESAAVHNNIGRVNIGNLDGEVHFVNQGRESEV
jgi:alpha-D-ribose 1-methylphosphonate 5-triphosphate synthase subunit PhnG